MYLITLNELICKCAEFTLYPTVITLNPDWEVFTKSVDKFFKNYQLTDRKEYKSYNFALSSNSSYLLAGETIQTKVLGVLIDLRKYSSSVPKFFDRVFISHSSKDLDVVAPFVKMLSSLGLDNSKLFCSSVEGYGIPLGENIYDYLKLEFTEKNTLVVMIMSDNYYNSKPSLNEMGAAWVMSKEYVHILIKGFEFNQIEGAVDPQKIGFKIEDKYRLNEFKDKLIKELRLPHVANWPQIRDEFLSKISHK